MAHPFLVLGAVVTSVVTAAVGVLTVPGWIASALDAAAISDLEQVASVQAASMSDSGFYVRTVAELRTGAGAQMSASSSVTLDMTVDEAASAWCAVALSGSGTYFARADGSPDTGRGATASSAADRAGCDIPWPTDAPPVESAPPPVPSVPPAVPEPQPAPAPIPPNPWPELNPGETEPGGVLRAGKDTIITKVTWPVPTIGVAQPTCVKVELTGEHDIPYPWSFDIKREGTPFYGDDGWWYQGSNQARFDVGAEWITVRGVGDGRMWHPDWSNRDVNGSRQLVVTACSTPDNPPTVRTGSAWYAATQSAPEPWTTTRACVTVTANGAVNAERYPFRFGWAGRFDLRAAKEHIVAAGRTVNYVGFSPSPSGNFQFKITSDPRTQPVQDRYDFETGTMLALHGHESKSVQACVYGY
jgi:hypothetical protein